MIRTNVTGSAKIYAHKRRRNDGSEFIQYKTSLGKKLKDETWVNTSPTVRFVKQAPPQIKDGESMEIEIDNAFFAFGGNWTPKVNGEPVKIKDKPLECPVYEIVVMEWHADSQLPDSFATLDDEDEPW